MLEDRAATYIGTFVDCPQLGSLQILENHAVSVDSRGFITSVAPYDGPRSSHTYTGSGPKSNIVYLPQGSFFIPTFCDLHLHAPQFLYQGTGLHLPLMQWLEEYAFKAEERVDSDETLATRVYTRLAMRLKENGTGVVLLFGTIRTETNLLLAKIMQEANIRAFIGKLSMDISPRPTYCERSASEALLAAESFVTSMRNEDVFSRIPPYALLVEPVLTPRFVPSCSDDLLVGLGELAKRLNVRVQSHLAEARDEIDWVKKERGIGDVEVFERSGLHTDRCVQAHCTYLTENDLQHIARSGTGIAHCPLSNAYFSAKPFPLREALNARAAPSDKPDDQLIETRINVGLGTDIAGGYCADVMSSMRTAVMVSRMREGNRIEETVSTGSTDITGVNNQTNLSIDWKESLYLATRGGALALGLPRGTGTFDIGAPFDAQLIKVFDPETRRGIGALDFFDAELAECEFHIDDLAVEKWWCLGNPGNRLGMWVQGKEC